MIELGCSLCDKVYHARSLSEIAGKYLLHSVQYHWEFMVALHEASPETIEKFREILEWL